MKAVWEALAKAQWHDVLALVAGCDDDPEALEAAGVAHWWLDDADATLHARERAYRLYRERDDVLGAARVAGALAWDSVLFGGRIAVGRGWLERGERLLRGIPLSPEHAWLAVREAEVSIAAGDPAAAHSAAVRAIEAAEKLGRQDLETVARSLEGLSLVYTGRVQDGMRRLDEAAVAATAGEISDPMWIGKVCCNLIAACERVGDAERASQWCAEVKDFATRWELRTLFNVCRTQYASVLLETGEWRQAETELEQALRVFEGGRRAALFDGVARLGELRRMQGRFDEARRLFDRAGESWAAQLGRIELALDQLDVESAYELAETLERQTIGSRHLDRVTVLSLFCRVAARSGCDEIPQLDELRALAREVGTPRARVLSLRAAGEIALARGDLDGARAALEDAIALARSPYDRSCLQRSLARALEGLGYQRRADDEFRAAQATFAELVGNRADGPLTRRENEVLALVSDGRSNRQIAAELVVSEHTVHRHVANILRKLGEPTRAAAAARAARDGLV